MSDDREGFILQARPRSSDTAVVITKELMDYFLIVKLPLVDEWKVYSIELVDPNEDKTISVEIPDYMWKQEGISRIKINSAVLSWRSGYHQYVVNMVDTVTNDTKKLFFSYIVQRVDKNRDYIYMNDSREEGKSDES